MQIKFRRLRAATKLLAHKQVANPSFPQRSFQRLSIELRRIAAVRLTARVHEQFDAVAREQFEKSADLCVAVADAVKSHGAQRIIKQLLDLRYTIKFV